MTPALAMLMLMGWELRWLHGGDPLSENKQLAVVGPLRPARYSKDVDVRGAVVIWSECYLYLPPDRNDLTMHAYVPSWIETMTSPANLEDMKPAWAERVLSVVTTGRDNQVSET